MFNLNQKERKKERAVWKEMLLDFFFSFLFYLIADLPILQWLRTDRYFLVVLFCINSGIELDLPPGQKIS